MTTTASAMTVGAAESWISYLGMIRILHLMDRRLGFGATRAVRGLTAGLGGGFRIEVGTIGRGKGMYRNALDAALKGGRGNGKGGRGNGEERKLEIIHAWGESALAAALLYRRIRDRGVRIAYSPAAGAAIRWPRWSGLIGGSDEVEVICWTAASRAAWGTLIGNGGRVHLIRPGVDFSRIGPVRDATLRARLGFGDEDVAIVVAGEGTAWHAHQNAIWATGMLHRLDSRYKMVLWGEGAQVERSKRFINRQRVPGLARVANEALGRAVEFEELVPAIDIAMEAGGEGSDALAVGLCHAASIRVIEGSSSRMMASRVLEMSEGDGARGMEEARRAAEENFSMARFLEDYRGVYGMMAHRTGLGE